MPGFATILSEHDITAVVDYVIGLGDGTAAAAAAPTGPAGTYSLHCALCHGVDGRGNELGPGILHETEEIVEYVRYGEDSMPAYSVEEISDTELSELVTYIRTELGR